VATSNDAIENDRAAEALRRALDLYLLRMHAGQDGLLRGLAATIEPTKEGNQALG
jgi:hypothetical protein